MRKFLLNQNAEILALSKYMLKKNPYISLSCNPYDLSDLADMKPLQGWLGVKPRFTLANEPKRNLTHYNSVHSSVAHSCLWPINVLYSADDYIPKWP